MATTRRLDPERRHNVHVGIEARQSSLDLPEPIAVATTLTAGVWPNLEKVVVPHIGKVALPICRHPQEILVIEFRAIATVGTIETLIRFALMPKDCANAVGQPRLLEAPKHPPVNRLQVSRALGVALVLIDARSTNGPVDHENRHFLARQQPLRQLHPPPT